MLPATTLKLWERLKDEPLLRNAVLVGGTALSLQIHHRRSDDLDFLYPAVRLPSEALTLCVRKLESEGFDWQRLDNPVSLEEFEIAGMELHDHQQDFIVDRAVKVSFFTGSEGDRKLLTSKRADGPAIATLPEIFALKALVAAQRSKTRDWFDLYVLLTDRGFTAESFLNAFNRAGLNGAIDIALARLCAAGIPEDDEGVAEWTHPFPAVEQMKARFRILRDECEILRARRAR